MPISNPIEDLTQNFYQSENLIQNFYQGNLKPWISKTANYTANPGDRIIANTTAAAWTLTLPANPPAGVEISVLTFGATTNALAINPNGNKLNDSTSNASITANRSELRLVWVDTAIGWLMSQAATASSGGGTTPTPTPTPTLISSGLIAEYRFNEGSGQQLTDYAGVKHGILGSGSSADGSDPTWIAAGLQFGAANKFVKIPSFTLEGQFTWQIAFGDNSNSSDITILATGAVGGIDAYFINNVLRVDRKNTDPAVDTPFPASRNGILRNLIYTFRFNGTAQGKFNTGSWASGSNNSPSQTNADFYFGTTSNYPVVSCQYYSIFYNRALTDAEVDANVTSLISILSSRSITV
jgi:hypothetical protein